VQKCNFDLCLIAKYSLQFNIEYSGLLNFKNLINLCAEEDVPAVILLPYYIIGPARVNSDKRHGPKSSDSA